MKRKNTFTIELINNPSYEFGLFINKADCEVSIYEQPEYKKTGIIWFKNPPKELFSFQEQFVWVSGQPKLWLNKVLLKESDKYNEKITDVCPIINITN